MVVIAREPNAVIGALQCTLAARILTCLASSDSSILTPAAVMRMVQSIRVQICQTPDGTETQSNSLEIGEMALRRQQLSGGNTSDSLLMGS